MLALCCFVVGGLWLYRDRENQRTWREFEISRCLEAVRDPGDSATRITEANCLQRYPPSGDRSRVVAFLSLPLSLYGIWKILAFVGRGFRGEGL